MKKPKAGLCAALIVFTASGYEAVQRQALFVPAPFFTTGTGFFPLPVSFSGFVRPWVSCSKAARRRWFYQTARWLKALQRVILQTTSL